MKSPITVGIIIAFLIVGAAAVIVPAEASVFSQSINNNHYFYNESMTGATFPVPSTANIHVVQSETIGPNPTGNEIWVPGTTSVYVISVPYDSQFSQNVITYLSITKTVESGQWTNWVLNTTLNVEYQPFDESTNSYSSIINNVYTSYLSEGGKFGNTVNNAQVGTFNVNLNFTQPNLNAMYGILTFKLNYVFHAMTTVGGYVSGYTTSTFSTYAQMYVVPGTGSLNQAIPSTVIQGHTFYMTGQTWFGSYHLSLFSPQGVQVENISIPQNDLFNRSYTLSSDAPVGIWHVQLYNSIVELLQVTILTVDAYHGVGGNNGYIPTPNVVLSKPSNPSGYYDVGQMVNVNVYDTIQPNMTVSFLISVWIGSQSQQPITGSSNYIDYEINDSALVHDFKNYTYSFEFVIPSSASNSPITISVRAEAVNSSGYFGSLQNIQTISVGYLTPPPGHSNLIYYLEIIGFLVAGLIAAYVVPDDILMKFGVFGSAGLAALMVYAFNIIHIGGL